MPAKPPRRAGTAPLDSRRANSRPGSRPADDDRSNVVGEPSRHGAGDRRRGNNSNGRGAGVPVTKPETREPILVAVRGFEVAIPVGPAPMIYAEEARDPGTLLLAETAEIGPTARALCVGGASGLLPVVAARLASAGSVCVVVGQTAMADQVEAAVGLAGLLNVSVYRSASFAPVAAGEFDVALLGIKFEPSAASLRRHLANAAALLRPGGRLYVSGGKREGIGSAADRVAELLGNAQAIAYGKGHRVVLGIRGDTVACLDKESAAEIETIETRGLRFSMARGEDLFAGGGLDEGTRLLIETMEIRATDTVVDLGCGGGIVGLVAARLAPAGRVFLVDSEIAAVELARDNLTRNAIVNATALAGDGLGALSALTDFAKPAIDVVVTNPPFHVGRVQTLEIANRFVADAARRLRHRGRLYLVANRFLRYEPAIAEVFGGVEVVAQNSKYKVLRATKL